ncbi:MAG: heme exporter protein CcmB, partial [Oceanospirillaceae bacterium]|nr:heme exporter protein CcmB [Oceanospirillaceae bacterium]
MSDRQVSVGRLFAQTFKRDLVLAFRRKSELVNPLIFFLIVVTLFPIGVSPEPLFLAELAPGLIWVAALLSTLLSLESLFKADFEDGSLEQLLLSPQPLFMVVLAKVTAHWLMSGLALTLVAPIMA